MAFASRLATYSVNGPLTDVGLGVDGGSDGIGLGAAGGLDIPPPPQEARAKALIILQKKRHPRKV